MIYTVVNTEKPYLISKEFVQLRGPQQMMNFTWNALPDDFRQTHSQVLRGTSRPTCLLSVLVLPSEPL